MWYDPLEGYGVCQVPKVDLCDVVALSLEGQDSVGPQPYLTIDTWCEMNTQERELRVRHLHKCTSFMTAMPCDYFVILQKNNMQISGK